LIPSRMDGFLNDTNSSGLLSFLDSK